MVDIIHSGIRGRSRYRVMDLYRSSTCKRHLETRLMENGDIENASANTLTGNVLVQYNSGNTPESIAAIIEGILAELRGDTSAHEIVPEREPAGENERRARDRKQKQASRVSKNPFGRLPAPTPQVLNPWHTMDTTEVLEKWDVSPNTGLSAGKVREQTQRYGLNVLPESVSRSQFGILAEQFQSLPVALLGVAAGISIFTGGIADALVIMGVVGINACIGYITESEAEKTIESLKNIVRPTALLIRDGRQDTCNLNEIVPGDVVVLRPGTYVPADCRLVESYHLSVDESTLTGESLPVLKTTTPMPGRDIPLGDRRNMVYMGTLVTGGQGLAVVVATGQYTELGQLQVLVGEAQSPETPMEKQLRQMGNQLVLISGGVCGAVFLIGLMRGAGLLRMLKTSIALAVAAVPEGLPAVATTTLALGIRDMKKHHVLIRKLDAVETLGSVQTICFDKTGTVTRNTMSVKRICVGMQQLELRDEMFVPACTADPDGCDAVSRLMHVCVLCNESEVIKNGSKDYVLHGTSTENALMRAAMAGGLDAAGLRRNYRLDRINHRSEDRHFMATLHETPHGRRLLSLKGSPLEVLSMCEWYIHEDQRLPLTEDARLSIEAENEKMSGEALRVLGFAYAMDCEESDFDELNGLIWLGLVGMADPIREGVKDLIPLFHRAGIDTIMITGDQSSTAYAIGKELDLSRGGPIEILDSTRLAGIEPETLKALSQKVHVFARVSPANKLQIVQALQSAGRIVAMTGDGINDGPALKAADIGVALGASGTDVAREVADVILEKDDLETMILAVSHGRTIYGNIRKALHFLLATNFSEIIVMFAASAIGLGYPLTAMQLLWINLLSDIFPGLALAMEQPESDVLERPPRDPREPIIQKSDFKRISVEAAVMSGGAMMAYVYGMGRYGAGPQAGTLAFQSLTLAQLLHAISCRSERHSIISKEKLPPNKYLNFALAGSIGIQLMTMFIPGLRSLLGLAPIGLVDAAITAGAAVAPLLINEALKEAQKDNIP
ncbi:MAG: HAD-IC family P-type ATPase [Syntrophobacter sp.]